MTTKIVNFAFILFICAIFINAQSEGKNGMMKSRIIQDFHSYSNPQEIRVTNVDLDWDILFAEKMIKGKPVKRTAIFDLP